MSFLDAVIAVGVIPERGARQSEKKRYGELLSRHLAQELAEGLRAIGFRRVRPVAGGPGERPFQGGLGPKKVDVSYADERHGLLLAVSIKTITSAPYGKNLKNRFYDLCPEAITLHMRFPYSVVCALFCFPAAADQDVTAGRPVSTFRRAMRLFSTISGRNEYTDPGEKFENVTMMLFQPVTEGGPEPSVQLYDSLTQRPMTDQDYLLMLRDIYNKRNPHAAVGDPALPEAEGDEEADPG